MRSGVGDFGVSWISLMNNLKPLQTITALFSSLGIDVMMPGSNPGLSHYAVCCCRGKNHLTAKLWFHFFLPQNKSWHYYQCVEWVAWHFRLLEHLKIPQHGNFKNTEKIDVKINIWIFSFCRLYCTCTLYMWLCHVLVMLLYKVMWGNLSGLCLCRMNILKWIRMV